MIHRGAGAGGDADPFDPAAVLFAPRGAAAGTAPVGRCADVVAYGASNTEVTSARQNPAASGLPAHCPSTSSFSPFAALVDWVEHGIAPRSITATAPENTLWPGRTRPLRACPGHAQYTSGDIEDTASFTCAGLDGDGHEDARGGDRGAGRH